MNEVKFSDLHHVIQMTHPWVIENQENEKKKTVHNKKVTIRISSSAARRELHIERCIPEQQRLINGKYDVFTNFKRYYTLFKKRRPHYPSTPQYIGEIMELTISSIRCTMQVALLGAVTENLRAVTVVKETEYSITIYFYYESAPNEEEQEISEIVVTEIYASFFNISVTKNETVLPKCLPIPEIGIRVFHRKESIPT